ncbi:MAG: hypothetical protein OEP95_04020, partial [Myxococcales bacterium]|nr:hypothetical protein [Myxococcales bacterium]
MGRIRLVFALVAVALAVPGALLVQRALESVEVERQARQRTVAERAFDEMERSLSTFLAAEEERPFEQYRFLYEPQGAVGEVWVRSPLSLPESRERWPFVVGHFQVDPDRSVHTPLEPRPEERVRVDAGWSAAPELTERIAEIRAAVETGLDQGVARDNAPRSDVVSRAAAQAPGTTVSVVGGKREVADALEADLAKGKKDAPRTYEALRQFNLGAESRKSRSRKVVEREVVVEEELAATEAFDDGAALDLAASPPSVTDSAASDSRPPVTALAGRLPAEAIDADEPVALAAEAKESAVQLAEKPALRAPGYLEEADAKPAAPETARPARAGAARTEASARVPEPSEGLGSLAREQARPVVRAASVRIAIDPLLGREVPGGARLLLYRTVLVGDLGYRQGLVVDRAGLAEWLRREV